MVSWPVTVPRLRRTTVDEPHAIVGVNYDRAIGARGRIGPEHHGHQGLALTVPVPQGLQIQVDHDVRVEHQKRCVSQQRRDAFQGPGSTQNFWFKRERQMHPPAAAITEPLGELVSVVMQVNDDVVDALAC